MAVSRWDSFPRLRKPSASGFTLGENGGPMVWRLADGSVQSHQQPPCRPWDVSQRPRARRGSCTPTRCLCGTWRSSGSALPVGRCGSPAGRPAPRTPLSKTPSALQRAPHPGRGLNPQVPPCKAVAVLEQGRCRWEMVSLGAGRGISGRAGAGAEAGAVLGIATGASHPATGCPSLASSCPSLAKLLG